MRHGFVPSGRISHSSARLNILDKTPSVRLALIGRVAHIVMERRDIAPLNIGHPVPADPGIDEQLD